MISSILIVLFAYLCGSISTAVWYGRFVHKIDIRNHGSGNAGATNSLRVLGKTAGVVVLIIDFLKGLLPVLLAEYLNYEEPVVLLVGFVAVIGHLLPIFSNFQGGKGVATAMGVIVAIFPLGALVCFVVFLSTVVLTKYVSLGSILGGASFPVAVVLLSENPSVYLILFGVALALLLSFTHRKNIERLLAGNESKFGQKA
ncbi:MAG: glycerol-3-phosphate 1-O-acyltransferase PlsY [Spirosomaceae bacterium]|nr:glycerol-3-phosphate 1-O-acyltransferase PlsY [Spirosomataceae bacterium]